MQWMILAISKPNYKPLHDDELSIAIKLAMTFFNVMICIEFRQN